MNRDELIEEHRRAKGCMYWVTVFILATIFSAMAIFLIGLLA